MNVIPLENLLKTCLGFPKKEKYSHGSLQIHEIQNETEENTILEGCYWVPKNKLPSLEFLEPVPQLSSLAPKSSIQKMKVWYRHPTNSDYLGVPKFFGLSAFGKPTKDLRKDGISIQSEWNPHFQLRAEQKHGLQLTLNTLQTWGGAFFIADCGFGKSVVIARLIYEIQKKTVVIVPRITLLHQMQNDLGKSNGDRPSILQAKTTTLQGSWDKNNQEELGSADIIIASLDSVASFHYPPEFWKTIGLVIFDEAHHMAAKTLSAILPHISSKRIVGFSATPNRKDGLEHVLYWLLGPVSFIYQRLPSITGKSHTVHIHKVSGVPVQDIYTWGGKLSYMEMVVTLVEHEERNQKIMNLVQKLLETREKILLISAIREHCDILAEKLGAVDHEVIHGGIKRRKTEPKNTKVLIATYGMLEEGFDDADLDTLILCTPRSTVQQTIGRIERSKEGKLIPLVYDFVDDHKIFEGMWWKRFHFYKSRGFRIEGEEKKEEVLDLGFVMDDDNE